MSIWRCTHYAMAISKKPIEQWADEVAKLPTGCLLGCGGPRSCRERNAEYLRVQYRALKRRQNQELKKSRQRGALL
ncbi:hypothetical protein U4I65_08555 [Stenotrophomonas maltophilia]|uniref:hypothetical protein n=1 Tax=Stenotrophomonas maltophilia TaxID=40324 RepID=UPI002ACCDCFD|nr:hypothetical protein [Stenotrophomonas maltophilia]MDZ5815082.1 hypothetical protein [Stenotrophomonas maltophilia]